MAGAGLLAACAAGEIAQEPQAYRTPAPFRSLPGAGAPDLGKISQTAGEGSISLEEFMKFSSLLTGVEQLDPNLGQVYLEALVAGGGESTVLADGYHAASSGSGTLPQGIEELNSTGFFDQEGFGSLADQMITMWYTGVVKVGEEEQVVTFVDALAWKVLNFTKPPTLCGQFGFWSREPDVEISPTIQFTPAPTQPGQPGGGGG